MCMEDITIGHSTRGVHTSVKVTTTSSLFVPYNADRIGLVLTPDPTNATWLQFDAPAVVGSCFNFVPTTVPVHFNITDHGALCHGPWYAIVQTTGTQLTYMEVLLPEK